MSEEFEFVEEDLIDDPTNLMPDYGSEEWEGYIMSQFTPEELYEGKYPSLNGLRRVSNKILGRTIRTGPVKVESFLPHSSYCVYEIEFNSFGIFGAAADGTIENISGSYSVYPTAIAESRAEARAYRKALMLSTASAEEIKGSEKSFTTVLETVGEYQEDGKISDQQVSILKAKCKQFKIDFDKFLESEGKVLEKATKSDGNNLAKKLSEFQTKGVPKELLK